MSKFSTYKNSLEVKTWKDIPSWFITQAYDDLFAIRIGNTGSRPKEVLLYKDNNISLCKYLIDSKRVLGYTLHNNGNFYINRSNWYLSLVNKTVEKHYNPEVIYKDSQVHIHKFNDKNNTSYMLAIRSKVPK